MSVQTETEAPAFVRVDWAPVPRVNLLPAEIIEARQFHHLKRLLALGVAVSLVVVAGAALAMQVGVVNASNALEQTQSESAGLQAQKTKYAEVPKVVAQVDAAKVAREKALGRDIPWYRFLTDLALNTPANTTLTSIDVTLTDQATATGQVPTPLTEPGLGTVTVAGSTRQFADVSAWLTAAGTVHGLSGSTLSSATREDTAGAITFNSELIITADALSHRYDRKAG
jgi:Tfp pilus assembly protein PilN